MKDWPGDVRPAEMRRRAAPIRAEGADERRRAEARRIATLLAARGPVRRDLEVHGTLSLLLCLVFAVALGGVLYELATDWMQANCIFPSQRGCVDGGPVFEPSDMPDPNWMASPRDGSA